MKLEEIRSTKFEGENQNFYCRHVVLRSHYCSSQSLQFWNGGIKAQVNEVIEYKLRKKSDG